MRVSELAQGDESGLLMQLQGFLIWNKDVEQLDTYMLLAHYLILKNSLGRIKAIELMRELKGECMLRLMLGDIEHAAIIDFRPPVNDLVGPNLLPFMKQLPFNARALILVALSQKQHIDDLISLQWEEVQLLPWTSFSRKVLTRIPPRLGCRYVFWEENTLGSPTPLLSLSGVINTELGISWNELAAVATNLIQFEHFAHPEIESLLGISYSG